MSDIDQDILTAYALGELDAAQEARVRAALETDEAARRQVEEIRSAAGLLTDGLEQELAQAPGLDEARRSAVINAAGGTVVAGRNNMLRLAARSVNDAHGPTPIFHVLTRGIGGRRPAGPVLVGVAALLLVGVLLVVVLLTAPKPVGPTQAKVDGQFQMAPKTPTPAVGGPEATLPPIAERGGPVLPPVIGPVDQSAWNVKPDPALMGDLLADRGGHNGPAPIIGLITGDPGHGTPAPDSLTGTVAVRPRTLVLVPVTPPAQGDAQVSASYAPDAMPPHGPGALVSGGGGSRLLSEDELRVVRDLREIERNLSPLPVRTFHLDPLAVAPTTLPAGVQMPGGASFAALYDNPFVVAGRRQPSSFALQTPGSAYAYVRRQLENGQWPPKDAVRIEDFVNYFPYHYRAAGADKAFSADFEMADCPWNRHDRLLRVAVMSRPAADQKRPAANIVLLIDSAMHGAPKLELVKTAAAALTEKLGATDRLAVVTYGPDAGVLLEPTELDESGRAAVRRALEKLGQAAGAGSGGIEQAYHLAQQNLVREGINRVVVMTDANRSLGYGTDEALGRLIKDQAAAGVSLDVAGVDMDEWSDPAMENLKALAPLGEGRFQRIDTLAEARDVPAERLAVAAEPVGRDVSVGLRFNPALVEGFRLLGYEKGPTDTNDPNAAGPVVYPGQTVTALYELIPAAGAPSDAQMLTLTIHWADPVDASAQEQKFGAAPARHGLAQASDDFKFAAAVAELGMVLRDSPYRGDATLASVQRLAEAGKSTDEGGYRAEFIELVRQAQGIK